MLTCQNHEVGISGDLRRTSARLLGSEPSSVISESAGVAHNGGGASSVPRRPRRRAHAPRRPPVSRTSDLPHPTPLADTLSIMLLTCRRQTRVKTHAPLLKRVDKNLCWLSFMLRRASPEEASQNGDRLGTRNILLLYPPVAEDSQTT